MRLKKASWFKADGLSEMPLFHPSSLQKARAWGSRFRFRV